MDKVDRYQNNKILHADRAATEILQYMINANMTAYEMRTTNTIWPVLVNPWRVKLVRGNTNLNLHFMSFLHIDMPQVVGILSQVG